jgi:tRNA A-37 threonylcarbamoyl transferase component Bud32
MSTSVEDKVRKAYEELHQRKILHGDIRAGNILVASNESIYIIDFESAHFDAELLDDEMDEVEKLVGKIRKEREQGLVKVGC